MRCNKMNCPAAITIATVAGVLAFAGAAVAQSAFRIGVFFDSNAQSCTGEIRNFEQPPQRAYVYALVPAGTVVNGALLRLVPPHGLIIDDLLPPHSAQLDGTFTGSEGLEITLQVCQPANGPVLLLSFDFHQFDSEVEPGGIVPDMRLQLKGGATADSLAYEKPQVKIGGEDCINGVPQLVEAEALQSTLNCTADCPCTTPVRSTSWADVKRRFLRP